MPKRLPILIGFIMLFGTSAFAQKSKADSMFALLKTEKEDTLKVSTLVSLGFQFLNKGNYPVGDSLTQIALTLSNTLNYKRGIARSLRNIGVINSRKGNTKQAGDAFNQALQLYQAMGDLQGQAAVMNSLGNMYDQTGDYQKALNYFYQVRDLFTQLKNKLGIGIVTNNIGLIYLRQGNNPKALENFLTALEIFHSLGQKEFEMEIKENVGIIYDEQGEYQKALSIDKEVLQTSREVGDKRIEANVSDNLGNLFEKEKKYTDALQYSRDGLRIHEENGEKMEVVASLNDYGTSESHLGLYDSAMAAFNKALALGTDISFPEGVASSCINIAALDTVKQNYAEALLYTNRALDMARKNGNKVIIQDAEQMLSIVYNRKGNYADALAHYKAYIIARDSIYSEQNTKKMVSEEMNYDFDKKQAGQKAEQDKKDAIAEQQRKKQAIIRNSFIAGFILMIALAFFIFRGYREKQKANEIISQQKNEVEQQKVLVEHQKAIVEEKNKDITDSIHYASRIQRALLTTDEYMGKHLKEYFILFKPRDIVSGDFYWAFNNGQNFMLCVGDCTGHGVPGAFMSLLNISMLNETVIERNITSPDLVLNDVRGNIIKALNPKGLDSESKDGMDCILASLSPTPTGLDYTYAAAYNPPMVIQHKAGIEVLDLPADKMPVGAQHGELKPFTLKKVSLQKGDCIYMFTDGYADQFGGDKGKKFKYKQLQQLIADNSHKPMAEQKELLNKTIEQWKGDLEQVDDILIIGIRV